MYSDAWHDAPGVLGVFFLKVLSLIVGGNGRNTRPPGWVYGIHALDASVPRYSTKPGNRASRVMHDTPPTTGHHWPPLATTGHHKAVTFVDAEEHSGVQ